jgi:predicted amidophosphoribosyltransferase
MHQEPDFDQGLDPDGPSAADLDRFGDEFTACPNCSEQFYDQADICPSCGHALGHEPSGIPLWASITGVVLLLAFIMYIAF